MGDLGLNDIRIDEDLTGVANGIYIVTINVDDRVFDKLKFGLLNKF